MKTKRNHRKLFVLSAIMLIGFMNLSAQTLTKTFTFNFDTEDFRLEQIGSERKCEFDMGLDYIYGKLEEPALPHVPYDILLPDNYRVQSFTYSIGDDTCRFNQVLFYPTEEDFMENNPDTLTVDCIPLYPTPGVSSSSNPGSNPPYPLQTFPVKVSHDGNYDRDGYRLENFTICPFIYHAVEQKLVLATSIELTVSIAPYDDATPSHKGTDDKWLKSHIYNPEDFGMGTENWTPASTGIAEETVSWVGATWSYYMYDYYPYENDYEEYSFFRYTVLDRPEVLDGKTYYPLVWYTTCEYEEDHKGYRIRQEGKKVLMRKEDCDYEGILKEIGNDYVLYDFSLNEGEEYCKYNGSPLTVLEVDTIQDERGQTYRQLLFQSTGGWETWIDGIGSTLNLLIPYTYPQLQRWYWHRMTLNYFCSADSSVIYRNPRTKGDVIYPPHRFGLANRFDHFKEEDCSLNPSRIKSVIDCSPIYIKTYNSKIHCTAPDAVKMEVYTMDAVKVGEARFTHGQAEVKINNTPATYLYIVTYPDGRRESGKVAVKGEG